MVAGCIFSLSLLSAALSLELLSHSVYFCGVKYTGTTTRDVYGLELKLETDGGKEDEVMMMDDVALLRKQHH
jgi:hypothetical protein